MTAKQYNKQKETLYKEKGLTKTDFTHEVMIDTIFGVIYISSEWSPKIKVGSIHTKLEGDAKRFKTETNYDINTFNGKYNSYFDNPEDCLNELEEFIDNLLYLNSVQ